MATRPSRWKAQHVGCQQAVNNVKADLTAEIERLRGSLQQIAWLADAAEPLSVKAAEIAQQALEG